jgi:hypothetical protein
MTDYKQAFGNYLTAAQAAVKFHDPNYTNNAITKERAKRLQAARAELAKVLPSRIEREAAPDTSAMNDALAQLAVTNADTAAVSQNEWAKVKAMLDNGRNLAKLIEQSDQRRLMAIMDHLDTDLVAGTGDEAGVRAEVSQAVLARLGDLGDAKAQAALAGQTAGAHDRAWHEVIAQATRGEVNIPARTALKRASADDYDAAFPDTNEATTLAQAISHLDHVAPYVPEAASGNASA